MKHELGGTSELNLLFQGSHLDDGRMVPRLTPLPLTPHVQSWPISQCSSTLPPSHRPSPPVAVGVPTQLQGQKAMAKLKATVATEHAQRKAHLPSLFLMHRPSSGALSATEIGVVSSLVVACVHRYTEETDFVTFQSEPGVHAFHVHKQTP
jgi:hypothetical protein